MTEPLTDPELLAAANADCAALREALQRVLPYFSSLSKNGTPISADHIVALLATPNPGASLLARLDAAERAFVLAENENSALVEKLTAANAEVERLRAACQTMLDTLSDFADEYENGGCDCTTEARCWVHGDPVLVELRGPLKNFADLGTSALADRDATIAAAEARATTLEAERDAALEVINRLKVTPGYIDAMGWMSQAKRAEARATTLEAERDRLAAEHEAMRAALVEVAAFIDRNNGVMREARGTMGRAMVAVDFDPELIAQVRAALDKVQAGGDGK